MPVQAQFHDMLWATSSDHFRLIKSFKYSRDLDIEKNEDSEGKPPSQDVRTKPDKITVSYTVARMGGVYVREEMEAWYYRQGMGIHAPFFLGGRHIFGQEYIVSNIQLDTEYIGANGTMNAADITVEFQEYLTEGGGLYNDKGRTVNFAPGIQDYRGSELDAALRAGAEARARARNETL